MPTVVATSSVPLAATSSGTCAAISETESTSCLLLGSSPVSAPGPSAGAQPDKASPDIRNMELTSFSFVLTTIYPFCYGPMKNRDLFCAIDNLMFDLGTIFKDVISSQSDLRVPK